MGLLAFPLNTPVQPYRDLLDQARWQTIIQQFRLVGWLRGWIGGLLVGWFVSWWGYLMVGWWVRWLDDWMIG